RRDGVSSFVVAVGARDGKAVSASTYRLDGYEAAFRVQLAPQPADEHFEHVGVAVEILLVDVLGEVGLGNQLAGVQHQVFQHLVFVAGEVDQLAFHRHRLRGGVQLDHAAGQD